MEAERRQRQGQLRDEHAWQNVTEVTAFLANVREQRHADSSDQESSREQDADAAADDVPGRVSAHTYSERERDEGEAG
jgi:hypothetical protein